MKVKRLLDKYFIQGISDIIWDYLPDFILEDTDGSYITCLQNEYNEIKKEYIKGILIIKTFIINKNSMFKNTENLIYIKGKVKIKTNDLSYCIFNSSFNQPLNWNTENVKNMLGMFCNSQYNQQLNWDVSKVTDMDSMFYNSQYNHPLNWDVSNVTVMTNMFCNSQYNHPLNWDVSNVTDT